MKAVAVFPGQKQYRVIDHPEPQIEKPTQAKLRMLDVGICGEVVETGPEAVNLRPGDLVVTSVRRPCGRPECVACAAGRQDFCYTGDFTENRSDVTMCLACSEPSSAAGFEQS